MKKSEIKVGDYYIAKVANKLTTVRVDHIKDQTTWNGKSATSYDVTNLTTNRKTTFRSAAKFRKAVPARGTPRYDELKPSTITYLAPPTIEIYGLDEDGNEIVEGEQGSDPTPSSTGSKSGSSPSTTASSSDASGGTAQASNLNTALSPTTNHVAAVAATPIVATSPLASGLAAMIARSTTTHPHVIVKARAGTGKTFTIMVGVAKTFEHRCPKIGQMLRDKLGFDPIPSPQQAKVWEQMALSSDARTVQMTAFNKSIVREFEDKWAWLITALREIGVTLQFATNHSMGFAAVRQAFGRRLEVSEYRVMDLIAEVMQKDIRELRKDKFEMLKATEKMVGLCKMNMVSDYTKLDDLAAHYDIEMNGSRSTVFDLVPQIIERCKDPLRDGRIDYNDMIWLPCALDLTVTKNDLLLVDESQDLNRCQQQLALKAGRRIVMVGDVRQAIYGFAGADADSMPRMERELGSHACGVEALLLTVTRRCGKRIVDEARKIVNDFEAHESNCEGIISEAKYTTKQEHGRTVDRPFEQTYLANVRAGDFVLCRVNAPLVSNCFKLLRRGIKATIQGRDIGQGLVSTIKKMKSHSVVELTSKIDDWLNTESNKERAKRNPSDARLIALQDRADCLHAFCDGRATVEEVVKAIDDIFTDNRSCPGVKFSSIHRAKGLEADRVFFLMPKGGECPHPMAKSAWQQDQEQNLLYVGITRAIKELVWVM